MKTTSQILLNVSILLIIWTLGASCGASQSKNDESTGAASKHKILMDIGHKPVFWYDPADMGGRDANHVDRVKYMTGELMKNAAALEADVGYLKGEIDPGRLTDCDLLFIHTPSAKYTPAEIEAITGYLKNGGSLFLVMDVDYWSSLAQTNVNDIIEPFGVKYGAQSPDSLVGGYTKAGVITDKALKIPYHGGRLVNGGKPFCFSKTTEEYPFGTYKELDNSGKIIIMGDGMVSLYMTSWQDVNDYQCGEFMNDVLKWLLE